MSSYEVITKDLEAVALLAEKATPGEWRWSESCNIATNTPLAGCDPEIAAVYSEHEDDSEPANSAFICALVALYRTHHAEIAEAVSLSRKAERMEDALHQVKTWSEAYPLSVFPEPDWKRAAEVLGAAGMTLDRISAANMRHVIERVQQIADAAIDAQHNSAREGV